MSRQYATRHEAAERGYMDNTALRALRLDGRYDYRASLATADAQRCRELVLALAAQAGSGSRAMIAAAGRRRGASKSLSRNGLRVSQKPPGHFNEFFARQDNGTYLDARSPT